MITMDVLIEEKQEELKRLCRQCNVESLELFGSAATDAFDPSYSDVDFAVKFLPMSPRDHADAYFDLLFALEDLLERRVDLCEVNAVTNPYFLKSIEQTRTVLYAV